MSVVDTTDDTVAPGTIPVGALPLGAAITPDGSRAYVTNSGLGPTPPFGNTVTAIDTSTSSVIGSPITVGDAPVGIAITPDGTRAYVANLTMGPGASVSVIDTDPSSPTYNTVTNTITGLPGGPTGVAITPDGSRAYVALWSGGGGAVSVIDTNPSSPTYNTVVGASIPVGGTPWVPGITPDGRKLYVPSAAASTVSVIDTDPSSPTYDTVTTTISSGVPSPFMVGVSPDGSRAYATSGGTIFGGPPGPGTVAVIDTTADATTGSPITTGVGSLGVAFTPDGGHAYVANAGVGTVSDVNTATAGTTAIPLTGGPLFVAMTPDQGPTASFAVSAGVAAASATDSWRRAAAGTPTTFDATASSDPDGTVARYDWDFGDGTTLANGGPTPAHTYEQAGSYAVTLTVTDDEGCSASQTYTGQTVSCNGTSAARKSSQIAVTQALSASPCSSSPDSQLASVSHWQPIGKRLRGRLKTAPGGHSLGLPDRSFFALQVRRIHRERLRALDRVEFVLDGQLLKTDGTPPYMASVDPRTLTAGSHTIEAQVFSKVGEKRTVSLTFEVCDFKAAAFSVGMSSKLRGAHPELALAARTDGKELKRVSFTLPRNLHLGTEGSKGRMVGVAELLGPAGKKTKRSLRLGPLVLGEFVLAQSAKLSARLSLREKNPVLILRNLAGTGTTAVQVRRLGGSTGMFRNPASCKRDLNFSATLTPTSGEPQTLGRSLKMCKASS